MSLDPPPELLSLDPPPELTSLDPPSELRPLVYAYGPPTILGPNRVLPEWETLKWFVTRPRQGEKIIMKSCCA